jgi:hypothetical protein
VDGHQNLPSDGHEANAMAITESHQDRRSSRCLPAAERGSGAVAALSAVTFSDRTGRFRAVPHGRQRADLDDRQQRRRAVREEAAAGQSPGTVIAIWGARSRSLRSSPATSPSPSCAHPPLRSPSASAACFTPAVDRRALHGVRTAGTVHGRDPGGVQITALGGQRPTARTRSALSSRAARGPDNTPTGAGVVAITAGGPADRAGMRPGDVIQSILC